MNSTRSTTQQPNQFGERNFHPQQQSVAMRVGMDISIFSLNFLFFISSLFSTFHLLECTGQLMESAINPPDAN